MKKKKELLKEIEDTKQREAELIEEFNRLLDETESEKTEIKEQIAQLCGDKYYVGVRIKPEQALEIIQKMLSGVKIINMDYELYEIDKEQENVSTK